MDLKNYIQIEQGFQSSVNIAYDLGNDEKISGFIPTKCSINVLEELLLSTYDSATDRAKILVGAYGKGKSHIILVLLTLLSKKNTTVFNGLLEQLKLYNLELYTYVSGYLKSNKRLLPVVIQGSNSSLTQSFLSAIQKALEDAGLSRLMPDTHFQAALNSIDRWRTEYIDTYHRFVSLLDCPVNEFCSELQDYSVTAYEKFEHLYPSLTSGSEFNPFLGFDVVDLYTQIIDKLCENGYAGIYVVYDEFSKYLESNITKASIADIKMLQDFAEKCARSKDKQMHLLLIAHKDIANYIDKLPKQKVDGWKGVSERFVHVELQNNFSQVYELIAAVIKKDDSFFHEYFRTHADEFGAMSKNALVGELFAELEEHKIDTVIHACYPLHPVTTFILPRLSELVAQNERTLFTFLSSSNRSTLAAFLRSSNDAFPVLTPDYLYDYFEPLFKKEPYTGNIRKTYSIAAGILSRIDVTGLEAKLVKTLALIDMVDRPDKIAPTPNLLIYAFTSVVSSTADIAAALDNLQNKKYVVYMKRSNHFLRLKNTTGSDIRKQIADTVEKGKSIFDIKKVLLESMPDRYLYPNRYNDEKNITRYFAFQFIYGEEFLEVEDWAHRVATSDADGMVFGIIPNSQEQIEEVANRISQMGEVDRRVLFALPNEYADIHSAAYEYEAVKRLRSEAEDDEALVAEYNIYAEDLEEVIGGFVLSYTKPEMRAASYYHCGERQPFFRKSQISQCLSDICYNLFTLTPVINNESLNKNLLPSVAINSRNRVVAGLLSTQWEPMLGLSGSGQDVSFMRSALVMPGLIEDITQHPVARFHGIDSAEMQNVISVIEHFFMRAGNPNGQCFDELYETLTAPEQHIGLKRGVIPIYLALVLHQFKEHLVIRSGDSEIEVSADLLNSINENPSSFIARLEVWSDEKAIFIDALEELYFDQIVEKEREYNSFTYVTRAMQRWFIALPQYSKNIKEIYCGKGRYIPTVETDQKFMVSLRAPSLNAREYLFDKLPEIYAPATIDNGLAKKLRNTKRTVDAIKGNLIDVLVRDIIQLFDPNARRETTLPSTIRDWIDGLKEDTLSHVFDGSKAKILQLFQSVTNDHKIFVERIAKAATGLRIDDWKDHTIDEFLKTMNEFKKAIEVYDRKSAAGVNTAQNGYKLAFVDLTGRETVKQFARVEYGPRGKLLKSEIDVALEEMGQALSEDEKRQILMEILEKMC